jgi:metal-sulfur cluster biosynthetic enzyme
MIRDINDPEHPLTLEQLRVVSVENIEIKNEKKEIIVYFTPTIPHCSMATIIGLMIRFKL